MALKRLTTFVPEDLYNFVTEEKRKFKLQRIHRAPINSIQRGYNRNKSTR